MNKLTFLQYNVVNPLCLSFLLHVCAFMFHYKKHNWSENDLGGLQF